MPSNLNRKGISRDQELLTKSLKFCLTFQLSGDMWEFGSRKGLTIFWILLKLKFIVWIKETCHINILNCIYPIIQSGIELYLYCYVKYFLYCWLFNLKSFYLEIKNKEKVFNLKYPICFCSLKLDINEVKKTNGKWLFFRFLIS